MKNQRDKLHQYQKRITVITNREKDIAKECLRNGDKRRALLALRKKKYQESLLAKTDQQLAQLEMLTSDVEFALVQKDVVFGLQQGTSVLKEIHKEMGGLERVEMIMGESEEAMAYQNVRPSALARLLFIADCCDRKSTRRWPRECPMQTRTRSKMNSRPWLPKCPRLRPNYPVCPSLVSLRLCQMCQMRALERGLVEEHEKEKPAGTGLSPYLHDSDISLLTMVIPLSTA